MTQRVWAVRQMSRAPLSVLRRGVCSLTWERKFWEGEAIRRGEELGEHRRVSGSQAAWLRGGVSDLSPSPNAPVHPHLGARSQPSPRAQGESEGWAGASPRGRRRHTHASPERTAGILQGPPNLPRRPPPPPELRRF